MKSFAYNSVVVTFANASVHLANYVVIAGIASIFGATRQTDAFFLALAFPTFFVSAVVNAAGSVFIPIFIDCKINRPQMLAGLGLSSAPFRPRPDTWAYINLWQLQYLRLLEFHKQMRWHLLLQARCLASLFGFWGLLSLWQFNKNVHM